MERPKITVRTKKLSLSLIATPRQRSRSTEGLERLCDSIQELGLFEPLVVRKLPKPRGARQGYVLLAGNRRYEALRALGAYEAIVILVQCSDRDARKIALVSNLALEPLRDGEREQWQRELDELDRGRRMPDAIREAVARSEHLQAGRHNLKALYQESSKMRRRQEDPVRYAVGVLSLANTTAAPLSRDISEALEILTDERLAEINVEEIFKLKNAIVELEEHLAARLLTRTDSAVAARRDGEA